MLELASPDLRLVAKSEPFGKIMLVLFRRGGWTTECCKLKRLSTYIGSSRLDGGNQFADGLPLPSRGEHEAPLSAMAKRDEIMPSAIKVSRAWHKLT